MHPTAPDARPALSRLVPVPTGPIQPSVCPAAAVRAMPDTVRTVIDETLLADPRRCPSCSSALPSASPAGKVGGKYPLAVEVIAGTLEAWPR